MFRIQHLWFTKLNRCWKEESWCDNGKTREQFARGVINETLERHKFFSRNQESGEIFDDYVTELKLLSKNCNFCETPQCFPSLLRDRIISGIDSDVVREKLLAEKDVTLAKTMEIWKSAETASSGMSTLRNA